MITTLLVIGIILVTIGVMITLYSIYIAIRTDEPLWIIGFVLGTIMFILIGVALITSAPTKQDILDNKAHYVKELNTYDNDTIVTYRIEFNKQTPCQ